MGEFWQEPTIVVEVLRRKLNALPIDPHTMGAFAEQMQLAVALLHHIGTKHYTRISMLAAVDILKAVDYVLLLDDEVPDSRMDGYQDDAHVIDEVFHRHQKEIKEFQAWLRTHH
jgi:hypothetical protein